MAVRIPTSRRWRRLAVAAAALGALLALAALAAGCDSLDDAEAVEGVTEVAVQDNSFGPRVIRVPAGTEVTWNWDEASRDHNVVSDAFESPTQEDGTFAYAFESPGTYDYKCTLHFNMKGRVIVTPE